MRSWLRTKKSQMKGLSIWKSDLEIDQCGNLVLIFQNHLLLITLPVCTRLIPSATPLTSVSEFGPWSIQSCNMVLPCLGRSVQARPNHVITWSRGYWGIDSMAPI
ncbi:hypothetical protein KIL84_014731 [Mauremys mutica]|uniref:Uncharacterized protein n=1 Tax=Mauremys mutica TaxID=74926 RepID=A0A9D3XRU8_9SAUR|nr:hypothetical protein KIL84_014731 [Mauremys mutica]